MDGLTVNSGAVNTVATFESTDSTVVIPLIDSVGSTQIRSIDGSFAIRTGGDGGSNANTVESLRIDTSGNVGIGTSSPTSRLQLDGAEDRTGGLTLSAGGQNHTYFLSSDFVNVHNIETSSGAAAHTWQTNGAERMRIDSSGNLLVGGTSAFGADTITLGTGGFAGIRNTSGSCLELRRDSTDGSILDFQKDGTTVGSIGSHVNGLLIGTTEGSDAFLKFESNAVRPSAWNGSYRDAAIDLGHTSSRFKDLYLSGGVYLGGTGAANKLDDYEEGTWTPVTKSGSTVITTTVNYAKYVKIGALVYVTAFVSRADGASLTSDVGIHGLPFQVASGSAQVSGSIWFDTTATDEVATNYFVGGTSQLQAKKVGASGNYVTADQFQNSRPYYMSGVYSVAL
jgi:hypothetical protein